MVNPHKDTAGYKELLKSASKLNFRRVSKFNSMAMYGAIKCLEGAQYDKNINIYTSSQYGCIQDMNKVLKQVSLKDEMLMPFDFLNVNGNNVGFHVASAISSSGDNFYITSEDMSFEKAFELACFDISIKATLEAVVGAVDESLDDVENSNSYIFNLFNKTINDASVWFYLSKKRDNYIAKIVNVCELESLQNLKEYIDKNSIDKIALNQFAEAKKEQLNLKNELFIDQSEEPFFGTQSALSLQNLLKYKGKLALVSLDRKDRCFVIHLERE
jgi:hypothetical protein